MKKIYFFAGLLLLAIVSKAQWIQNEGFIGGGIINDIISYKNNIYIAIADNGLYSSSDNGDSWAEVNIDHNWSIDRLGIHQDTLIAATSGFIFKTGDGINWNKYEQPGSFVKDVQSDGQNLYIANGSGGLFKSVDDGQNWIDINDENTATGLESFHKAGEILYAGKRDNSGTLFKSLDDGLNWEQISIGESYWINGIESNSKGIYLNLSEKIFFSDDGGLSWVDIIGGLSGHRITNLIVIEDIIYINANGQVFQSSDNGGNWQGSEYYLSGFNSSSFFVGENNLFIGMWGGGVARNNNPVNQEWSKKNSGLFLDNVHQIEFLNDVLYVGTEFSFVKSSTDNGKTWHQESDQYNLKGGDARKMAVFKEQVYVGGGGSGISTKNGNGNWERVSEELPGQIIDGLCANKEYLFTAVSDHGVYRSEDPSDSWVKKNEGLPDGIRDLYSFGRYLFAGTYNGIFLSSDNAESWVDISMDIPDRSINSLVLLDSTIIAATQNGGAFRKKISDNSWEKISGESIRYLKLKNRTIFKCSAPGNVAISYNIGDTWELMNNDLPSETYITTLGFSSDYIYAGFGRPGQGIWQRNIHELIPPAISDDNEENEDKVIRENEPIKITYDQQLLDDGGIPIDSTALQPYIKVYNSIKEEVEFSASIDTASKIIQVSIEAPEDGEIYTVQLDSMANKSNLKTGVFTSQPYTFAKNNPPDLNTISKNAFENNQILISKNEILSSYNDTEEDPLVILHITDIPKHGTLTMNGSILTKDTFIDASDLSDLLYSPNEDFIGNDTIKWNAFDGYDYSEEISSIYLTIEVITDLKSDKNKEITVFPNPSSCSVIVTLNNNQMGDINYSIVGIDGKVLHKSFIQKNKELFEHSFSIEDFSPGIYIIKYSSTGFNQSYRIIKQ